MLPALYWKQSYYILKTHQSLITFPTSWWYVYIHIPLSERFKTWSSRHPVRRVFQKQFFCFLFEVTKCSSRSDLTITCFSALCWCSKQRRTWRPRPEDGKLDWMCLVADYFPSCFLPPFLIDGDDIWWQLMLSCFRPWEVKLLIFLI